MFRNSQLELLRTKKQPGLPSTCAVLDIYFVAVSEKKLPFCSRSTLLPSFHNLKKTLSMLRHSQGKLLRAKKQPGLPFACGVLDIYCSKQLTTISINIDTATALRVLICMVTTNSSGER